MTDSSPGERFPDDFAGLARLFPLPNLVMFPHILQPLHVFESRYVSMLEDSLADDRLLAMALLQPGWEADYEGRPPVCPVVCMGRVVSHSRLEGGEYNLLLQGLRRAAIVRERPPVEPFRVAEVAVLEDLYPAGGGSRRARLRAELLQTFHQLVPQPGAAAEHLAQLQSGEWSLGALIDIVAYSLEFSLESKQRLLAEWNVDLRGAMLLEQLRRLGRGETSAELQFPPRFSDN